MPVKWLREWWLNRRAAYQLSEFTANYTGLPSLPGRDEVAAFRSSGMTPREWYQALTWGGQ